MRQMSKIDNSLLERRGILELIARLAGDGITVEEMEEIGLKLREGGRRALRPLFRELWRETSGELIARYAYILDYFDTDTWLAQLIQIAIKRSDLGEDGRAALNIALEGYGVDVDAALLTGEAERSGMALSQTAQSAVKLGEEGIVSYLDDFLAYPSDAQQLVIRQLPESGESQAARMLEAMLWHDDPSVVRGALTALGRIRDPLAAGVLSAYLKDCAADYLSDAERSLRRLAFLRIQPPPPHAALPFHEGYASPPDGDGYRSLLVSRWVEKGRVAMLYLQVHERRGMLAAWGAGSLTEEEFQAELDGFCSQDDLQRVPPGYVIELVRDSLYWSRELCHLPADFYLRRGMFAGQDLSPARYLPDCAASKPRSLSYRDGEETSREVLSDPFFAGWFMSSEQVYDLADRFKRRDERERVLDRFCSEILAPEAGLIRERLLLCADLMRRCGRDDTLADKVVALAGTLADNPLPLHLHPFLRRFALESLETAREALEQELEPLRAVDDL
jgi:hypothetical protein